MYWFLYIIFFYYLHRDKNFAIIYEHNTHIYLAFAF